MYAYVVLFALISHTYDNTSSLASPDTTHLYAIVTANCHTPIYVLTSLPIMHERSVGQKCSCKGVVVTYTEHLFKMGEQEKDRKQENGRHMNSNCAYFLHQNC